MRSQHFQRWHLKAESGYKQRVPVEIIARVGVLKLTAAERVTKIRLVTSDSRASQLLGGRVLRSLLERRRLVLCRENAFVCVSKYEFQLDFGWPFDEVFYLELQESDSIDAHALKSIWLGENPSAWRK